MHLPVLLPLSQVTSSKCEVDEDWFHQERVATEQDCRAFCDSWLPEPGCKFSAWIPDDPYNCRLYTESFHFYLRQVSEVATCQAVRGDGGSPTLRVPRVQPRGTRGELLRGSQVPLATLPTSHTLLTEKDIKVPPQAGRVHHRWCREGLRAHTRCEDLRRRVPAGDLVGRVLCLLGV